MTEIAVGGKNIKHGSQYAYKIMKCRCDDCKAWNTAEQIKYRVKRREKGEVLVNGKWKTVLDLQLPS
jgi:hypothetical protein